MPRKITSRFSWQFLAIHWPLWKSRPFTPALSWPYPIEMNFFTGFPHYGVVFSCDVFYLIDKLCGMRYMTVKDARDLVEARTGYPLSIMALYKWIREGKLPAVRLGRRYLVSQADIDILITPTRGAQNEKGGQI